MIRPIVLGAVLATVGTAPLLAQLPPNPPAPEPLQASSYPAPQEATLPNGLRLIVIENHRQPIVSTVLSLPAGTAADPDGKQGLSDLMASLLTRGAGSRSAGQVALEVERMGGSFSASANPDFLTLQVDVLTPHLGAALGILADEVLRARLDSADIAFQKQQMHDNLQTELGTQGAVTARIFLVAMYGKHPYGSRPTPETVAAITRADLDAFRKARFRPAGSLIVLSGDISLAEARRQVSGAFAGWTGPSPTPIASPPRSRALTSLLLVHNPGAARANIIFGNPGLAGPDTNAYAALVAARVLADPAVGRLPRLFTQVRGWTDATFASLLRTRQTGLFQSGVDVPVEVADSALADLLGTLQSIRSSPIPTRELNQTKQALIDGYPFTLETAGQLAAAVSEAWQLGLPPSFLRTFRQRIQAITPERLHAAARRLIAPDSGLVVIVGDGARLYRPLSALGKVQLVGLDGSPLKLEEIEASPVALEFEVGRMSARRDTMLVVSQNRVVGRQVYALEPNATGFVYAERTEIGQALSQVTRVDMDSSARMLKLDLTGKAQGRDTKINLTYGSGRVTGSARVSGPEGARSYPIDMTVTAGVIDDNAIQALLPFLKWGPNRRWEFQVFSAGENRIKPLTLTVVSQERIPVGQVEVDAYKAVLEGGDQRVTFYVGTSPAHKLLRVSLDRAPIDFVAQTP